MTNFFNDKVSSKESDNIIKLNEFKSFNMKNE